MSVTEETSQDDMSRLKDAARSMLDMSVTLETSHEPMSPLNDLAPLNIPDMSVTLETSHPERSPSKDFAPSNIRAVLVTPERSGTSVALLTMLAAPEKAQLRSFHWWSPHWSSEMIWSSDL